MNASPFSALPPPARRFHAIVSRVAAAACAAAVFVSAARAVVPMIVSGSSDVASYSDIPWTLQKTGTFVAGATAGTGTVNWTVTATKGTPTSTFSLIGYVDMANGTSQPVPVRSIAVNLQRVVAGDFATVSSDIADATLGDAATTTTVDPDVTYEGLSSYQENAVSGSLILKDASNTVVALNGAGQTVPAQSTARLYFVATFNAGSLNVVPGEPLQVEVIVNFPTTFVMPSLSTLTPVTAPTPTVANASVSLADPSVTASGTVTTGVFTGLSQLLSGTTSSPVSITVDGGTAGGTVCNTATLTSPATTIPLVVNGAPVPLVVIAGVNLTASDCQSVPKRPGTPHPISTTINSCSQVVTYDASLFTSPNGPIVSASFNPASGSTFPFGTSTVDFSVTDSEGITATGVLYVNVIDSEAPVIAPVNPMVLTAPKGSCTATATYTTNATDCNLRDIVFSPVSGSAFPIGTSTVTITATDTAGHQSTSTFTVTVNDAEAPVLHTTNVQTAAAAGTCGASVAFAATADDCSPVSLIYSLSPTFTPTISSGANFPVGTTTVYVKATDASGNASTDSFTVTVLDTQAPVITAPNISVAASAASCGANVTFAATADDCSPVSLIYSLSPTFTPTISSGANFPVGTTTVYVKATDASGNASTRSFTVTVLDTQAPVITAPNISVAASATSCGANVTFAATASDCGATTLMYSLSSTFATTIASGANFPIGTTTVYVKAADASGNVSATSFTVTVVDATAPVIKTQNYSVNNTPGQCGATVPFAAQVSDCSAVTVVYSLSSTFTPTISSGASFPIGTTTVYVKATDASGNSSTTSFTVTVKDTEGPTITSPLTNITLTPNECECYATFSYTPTAVDNCGGSVKVTVNPASGTILAAGTTTTVTVTATDSAGNVTTKTFTVTVGKCPVTQTTYTQGGWGAVPQGNNPGTLLWKYFTTVYPYGLTVGGKYTAKFTSASAITDALPLTGTPAALTKSYINPTSGNTFASQTVALKLNVDFSARGLLPINRSRLGDMKLVSGELAGWTVSQVLSLCNTVLGGYTGALPAGVTIADLTNIAGAINGNFDNGTTNNGYLKY